MINLRINVRAWSCWEPSTADGYRCHGYWGNQLRDDTLLEPDVTFVKPMLRRRLDPAARASFHVLSCLDDSGPPAPLVTSSYMGSIKRTQRILQDVSMNEAVSPTAFSLSVHNALGGLWSLTKGLKEPVLAMSPETLSPHIALVEAYGLLQEGRWESVNVLLVEEHYPDFYETFLDSPPSPIALALRLDRTRTKRSYILSNQPGEAESGWNSILSLTSLLSGTVTKKTFGSSPDTWTLELSS